MVVECEVCGRPFQGRPFKVRIEGTILQVCRACSDLGEKVEDRPRHSLIYEGAGVGGRAAAPSFDRSPSGSRGRREASSSPHGTNMAGTRRPAKRTGGKRPENQEDFDLVQDYNRVVRKARGSMRVEDFAESLNEKASVIQKIEARKLKPTHQLARKIEKKYHVKLLEKKEPVDDYEVSWKTSKKDRFTPTLGDFIKKKD